MPKQFSTTEAFIAKAFRVHGKVYNYSETCYVNSKTKIAIVCSIHGRFFQTPSAHLQGNGCPHCGVNRTQQAHKCVTPTDFLRRAQLIHGARYEYPEQYVSYKEKINIVCSVHGKFPQTPDAHLRGQGCPKCKYATFSKQRSMSTGDFVRRATEIHGNKYDYQCVEYVNARTSVSMVCPHHGEFLQRPADHVHKRAGCPMCKQETLQGRYTQVFFDANPSRKETPCTVYLLRLAHDGETYLKVGITTQELPRRLSLYPHKKVDVLSIVSTTLYHGWLLEQQVLSTYARYATSLKFPGNTECLCDNIDVINYFNQSKGVNQWQSKQNASSS